MKTDRRKELFGPQHFKSEIRNPKSAPGVARTKMLVGVPGKEDMWKTTEYTEYTEKRLCSCVYSVYSVVSQSNGIVAKMASILEGRSETNPKSKRAMFETWLTSLFRAYGVPLINLKAAPQTSQVSTLDFGFWTLTHQ
jgi:hypothetical protein